MRVFRAYKSTIIGLLILIHNYWYFNVNDILRGTFEGYFLGITTFLGFLLLLTGDKWIDTIIQAIINKFIKK